MMQIKAEAKGMWYARSLASKLWLYRDINTYEKQLTEQKAKIYLKHIYELPI